MFLWIYFYALIWYVDHLVILDMALIGSVAMGSILALNKETCQIDIALHYIYRNLAKCAP